MPSDPISSAEGFPVKTLATPAKAKVSREPSRDSGASSLGSFASYDPGSSSWKTCQLSLLEDSETFSEIWPRAGMMRNGIVSQRVPSAPLIKGTGYLSLPRPIAHNAKESGSPGEMERSEPGLGALAVKGMLVLSTPTASQYGSNTGRSAGGRIRPSLGTMASRGLLATPTAKGNQLALSMEKHPGCVGLKAIHPTGPLSPIFLEWMMGFQIGWTECDHSGMPSCLPSLRSSGG